MKTAATTSLVSRADAATPAGEPCIMVIFGASGDLTRRLLMPALYNLACDGLLPHQFAVAGMAMDELSDAEFRERMSLAIRTFNTRKDFDAKVWEQLCSRLYYTSGNFDAESSFARLLELVTALGAQYQTGGNVLFYLATPPSLFDLICARLDQASFKSLPGWKRIIVEKPFGTDLASAQELNRHLLAHWDESQIYRVDHYLGKETVQNILAFRFSNQMFEPLWNKEHIDHIQINVAESVSVEGRGAYYERAGILRDMIQNHMLQMLAYVCMEPPASFAADGVRDEKVRVLRAVRVYTPAEALANSERGQYGAGTRADGKPCPPYRDEPGVAPRSAIETFAALRLFIDNGRWEGVPVYLRSGKALWKRGTEVVVQFRKVSEALFRGLDMPKISANRLIFHVQPDQLIESIFQAKVPGPRMQLQTVSMRFSYGEAFRASRATGYEVMIYNGMRGDATLFSRTDLVETAWRIAQPFLDAWAATAAADFPNYEAGSWEPRAAYELIERDGRHWFEVVNRETLQHVPLFRDGDPLLLNQVSMALTPRAVAAGETIIRQGEAGSEMYLISRGEVEVLDANGRVQAVRRPGDCFGELALLLAEPRTATVRARTPCDLFVLERSDFLRILREHQQFAHAIETIARDRYHKTVPAEQLIAGEDQ